MPRRDIRVVLLDDQELIYRALNNKFRFITGAKLVGHVTSQDKLADFLATGQPSPDIVLMDIQLSNGDHNGFTCTDWLRKHHPSIRVIGYSNYTSLKARQDLIDAGACAFIEKGSGPNALRDALVDVYQIRHHLNEFVSEDMLNKDAGKDKIDNPRQIRGKLQTILWLCTTDLNEAQIADLMILNEKTVRNHIAELRAYFKVKKTKAMVAQAFWQGIMPKELPTMLQEKVDAILLTQPDTPYD